MAADFSYLDLPAPDLVQFLDADPSPTFLIPIDLTQPIAFHLLIYNCAFEAINGLEGKLREENSTSLRFRSWAQAVVNWSETYDFNELTWTAFSIQGRWKAVRAGKPKDATSYNVAKSPPRSQSPIDNTAQKDANIEDATSDNVVESPARVSSIAATAHRLIDANIKDATSDNVAKSPAKVSSIAATAHRLIDANIKDATSDNVAKSPARVSSIAATARRLIDANIEDARLESLRRMIEMTDVGVFEFHPSGTLIKANEAWYKLSLHPREDEAHKDFSFMDLVYPPDLPLVMSQWNKVSQGIPATLEMRWKAPKREEPGESEEEASHWILWSAVPVLDDKGDLFSISGNTIDISSQKRVQRQALQRIEALERARVSEQKLARFAELAPVGIYIFHPDKGIEYCNRQFFELTAHPHMEPKDVDWANVIFPEDIWIVEDGWKVLIEEKKPSGLQFRLLKIWDSGDGKVRQAWVQAESYPECDADGNVVSILGALTDITRFKWAEEVQLTRVEEALEAKRQQEKWVFISFISYIC
jgi:PAS domain-containing protein